MSIYIILLYCVQEKIVKMRDESLSQAPSEMPFTQAEQHELKRKVIRRICKKKQTPGFGWKLGVIKVPNKKDLILLGESLRTVEATSVDGLRSVIAERDHLRDVFAIVTQRQRKIEQALQESRRNNNNLIEILKTTNPNFTKPEVNVMNGKVWISRK